MSNKVTTFSLKILRGVWVISSGGIVATVSALSTFYFLFPLAAQAAGLTDVASSVDAAAGAIEHAADGSIVRMLLIALIISLATHCVVLILGLRLVVNMVLKPCLLQSKTGHGIIRDVMWEIWREMKSKMD